MSICSGNLQRFPLQMVAQSAFFRVGLPDAARGCPSTHHTPAYHLTSAEADRIGLTVARDPLRGSYPLYKTQYVPWPNVFLADTRTIGASHSQADLRTIAAFRHTSLPIRCRDRLDSLEHGSLSGAARFSIFSVTKGLKW